MTETDPQKNAIRDAIANIRIARKAREARERAARQAQH